MNKEKIIRYQAHSLLLQNRIQTLTLDNLVYIIEDQGYEIVEYGSEDFESQHLLDKMGLTAYARARKAFTYKQGLARFVFIFEDLSAKEKLLALAHEVGHIACSHLKDGNTECSVDEEYEANEFAHHLLNPGLWFRIKAWVIVNKACTIAAVATVLVVIAASAIIANVIQNKSYYGEYYITESGEKYHQKDCIFIKDKNNIERLTEKDYYSGEYDPCQICLPE
jgi:Zn-dependent peptidase ImmA (M78 family)